MSDWSLSFVDEVTFLICVIGCADHCVYEALVPSAMYLGGRVVVGSAFYEILWGLCLVIIRTILLVMRFDFFSGRFRHARLGYA